MVAKPLEGEFGGIRWSGWASGYCKLRGEG